MAEKGFGVKEVNLIGASGTPTITSPNNLNLNANNVAISTNVSIGGTLSVTGNVSVGGTLTYEDVTNIDSVGVVTARAGVVIGDTSNTTFRVHRTQGASATNCGLSLNSGGSLDLFTDSSGAGTSRISISNTGNIQFSTMGSTYFLLEDYVTHAGDTNTQYGFNGADSYEVKTGGSTRLTVNNSGANVVGALTVNGSALSIDPTATDVQVAYELLSTSASGAGWRITGNGIVNTVNNPDIYLIRGQKYRFINNSGGSHPFRIQSDSSTAYGTGVTNNNASSGNIDFVPLNDAPARLYYNCTNHGGMLGNLYLRDAAGGNTNVGVTTFNAGITVTGGETFISGDTNPCLSVDRGSTNTTNINIKYNGSTRSQLSAASNGFEISAVGSTAPIQFFANGTEKVRIPAATWGLLVTSLSSTGNTGGYQTEGVSLRTGGDSTFVRSGNPAVTMTRKTDSGKVLDFYNGTTYAGGIYVSGSNNTALQQGSDYRLKTDITSMTDGINKVKQLNPIYYKANSGFDTTTVQNGFLAHEVQSVLPTLVDGEKDAPIDEKGKGYQTLNYAGFTPTAIAAIKELIAKVETLEAEVAVLKGS